MRVAIHRNRILRESIIAQVPLAILRIRVAGMLLALTLLLLSSAVAQDPSRPPQDALPVEKLAMEQIEELLRASEYDEALASLHKLYDQSKNSLIARDGVAQHMTLRSQHYIPLRQWCQERTEEVLAAQPALRDDYVQAIDAQAAAALATLQLTKDPAEARTLALRYQLSTAGDDFSAFLADLYLERGWALAAAAELNRMSPALRYHPEATEDQTRSHASIAWPGLWTQAGTPEAQRQLVALWEAQFAKQPANKKANWPAVVRRLLIAAAMQPELLDRNAMVQWISGVSQTSSEEQSAEVQKIVEEVQAWELAPSPDDWTTFAGDQARGRQGAGRYDLAPWPLWQQQLEGFGTSSDRTNASKPRVGETERGALPYYPSISDGKVFINELNRIRAYDLESGKPWPDVRPSLPLFDSHIATAAYVPLGYPLVGVPRGTLSIHDDCLYARMGSPVTGWANRESASDGGSLSYLVGLDLARQGSLLRGFPLRLIEPIFSNAEFEGCPIVIGDLLAVPIVERDNVGVRRSVVAFDRFSGELVWRSAVLAAGTVEGSDRANLITHQLLTYAGGRIFYNTNLGAIACLEPLNGETEWLVSYSRFDQQQHAYPTPDRFRYRDMTPCLVAKGLIYCMPQDCAELFAIDAMTGDLLWSTDDMDVADAIHLLGVVDDCLIVSGDRLLWLDHRTGRVLGRFPGSTTPGLVNALPSPRGLGRGIISDGEVYWPTATEVFIFDADMARNRNVESPPIKRRELLGARGNAGGNFTIAAGHLIFCGPSRVMAFKSIDR